VLGAAFLANRKIANDLARKIANALARCIFYFGIRAHADEINLLERSCTSCL